MTQMNQALSGAALRGKKRAGAANPLGYNTAASPVNNTGLKTTTPYSSSTNPNQQAASPTTTGAQAYSSSTNPAQQDSGMRLDVMPGTRPVGPTAFSSSTNPNQQPTSTPPAPTAAVINDPKNTPYGDITTLQPGEAFDHMMIRISAAEGDPGAIEKLRVESQSRIPATIGGPGITQHTTMSAGQAASNATNDPYGAVQDWNNFQDPLVQKYWNERRQANQIFPWDTPETSGPGGSPGPTPGIPLTEQQRYDRAVNTTWMDPDTGQPAQPYVGQQGNLAGGATTGGSNGQFTLDAPTTVPKGNDITYGYNTQMGSIAASLFGDVTEPAAQIEILDSSNVPMDYAALNRALAISRSAYETELAKQASQQGLVANQNYNFKGAADKAAGQQGSQTQTGLNSTLSDVTDNSLVWQDPQSGQLSMSQNQELAALREKQQQFYQPGWDQTQQPLTPEEQNRLSLLEAMTNGSSDYAAAGQKAGAYQDLRSTVDPITGAKEAPKIATAIDIANAAADPTQQFGRENKSLLEDQIGQSINNLTIDKQAEIQREQDMITQQFQQQREQLARMYATDPSGINSGDAQRQFEVLGSQEAQAKAQAHTAALQRIREEERANIGTMLQTQQSMQQGDLAARADYLQQKGLELEAAKYQEGTRQFDETLKQQVAQFAQQYGLDQTQANAMVDQTYAAINSRNKELDANIDQMVSSGKLDYAKFNMSADQFKAQVQQQELARQTDIAKFSSQFGLDTAQFEQAINESDRQFALANENAANQYGLDVGQFELAQWKMRDDAQARDTARNDAVTQFAQSFNLDAANFNMALADTQAKWEQTNRETAQKFGMDEANYMLARQDMQERYRLQEQAQADQRNQFADSFGLDKDKFGLAMVEADRAWDLSSKEQAQKFGMDANQFALARAEFENKVEMGNMTFEQASEEAARAYNLDATKFKQATVEAGKQYELQKGQIAQDWQLDQQKFGLAESQFNSDKNFRQQEQLQIQDAAAKQYGLDTAKFQQAAQEADRTMDLNEQNSAEQYGLDVNQFNLAKYQAEQASVSAFKDLDLRATTTAQQYGMQKDQFNRAIEESDRTFRLTESAAVQQMGMDYNNFEMAKQSFDTNQYRQEYMWNSALGTAMGTSLGDGSTPPWISGDQHATLAATIATGQQYNVGQSSGGGIWGAVGSAVLQGAAGYASRPVG